MSFARPLKCFPEASSETLVAAPTFSDPDVLLVRAGERVTRELPRAPQPRSRLAAALRSVRERAVGVLR